MSLQQQRAALAAPDVPHDDAVVGGPREQQPLDGVPPQGCYATCTERSTPVTWGGRGGAARSSLAGSTWWQREEPQDAQRLHFLLTSKKELLVGQ